jgi:hypothetical protein
VRDRAEDKAAKDPAHIYKALISLEDNVGLVRLGSRNGQREELQRTLSRPHEFRKNLIRIFQLKGLRWSLLRRDPGGELTRLPVLMQILEEGVDYVIRVEARKQKRPTRQARAKGNTSIGSIQGRSERLSLHGNPNNRNIASLDNQKDRDGRHTLNLPGHRSEALRSYPRNCRAGM